MERAAHDGNRVPAREGLLCQIRRNLRGTVSADAGNDQEQRGGLWDYVSPSRLGTWLSCPLKFRLKYVEGMQVPTSPNLFLGKRVHAGLEVFYPLTSHLD